MSIYLCHKCGGNLCASTPPLYGCQCISGWVQDWQVPVSFDEAKKKQTVTKRDWIAFFEKQGRDPDFMAPHYAALARLEGV